MITFPNNQNPKPYPYATTIGFSLAAFLLFLAIIYGNQQIGDQLIFTDSPFEFHVYCPISSKDYLKQYINLIASANVSQINNLDIKEDIYVVYVQARPIEKEGNSVAGLYYCGLARPWLGSCQNAKIICSSPGPMFYLAANSPAYIIWINSINTNGLNWAEEDCYSPDSDNDFCTISARLPAEKSSQMGCAYQDPTNIGYKSSPVRIDRNHVPISPHIHGLSVRPTFDGNPLSWFDNAGNFGIGYSSLDNPEYFKQFSNPQTFYKMPYRLINQNIKINYAANAQPAGNLFYHDHPMRSTKYNVKSGLNGLYIIYDNSIESQLPPIDHQKFILFSANIDGDARENLTQIPIHKNNRKSGKEGQHGRHKGHLQTIYTLNATDVFQRNSLYRFRILNSHFDNIYTAVSFSVYYSESTNKKGQKVITQIDPSNITYNLTQNQHNINFTMIGADSTIFNKFIPNLENFDLGVAERVEILIRFNEASGVPKNVRYYYLTCIDGNADGLVIKYKFKLVKQPEVSTSIQSIPTGTNNPYTNLSLIDSKKVVLKRMRPLLSLPRDEKFVINGHYMFDKGASDKPKIGTIEDWYFINTLFEAHPIHFHLVNFQVVQTFTLRMVQEECSLYEVDYLRTSGYAKFKALSNKQLCDYIKNNITDDEAETIFHSYNSLYLENSTQSTAKFGKISGFNVLQPASKSKQNIVTDQNCPLGRTYKYLCKQTSTGIPEHYRRWKDTVLINPFSVSVLRIRQTMTEYNEKVQAYPYFKIPEDQLMEFPGFVYHCHILPHEDNEMMRPYMLQPSDVYLNNIRSKFKTQGSNSNLAYNWSDKYRKINNKLGCHDYL